MTFAVAIKTCFSKYATFEGRASRSEFWFFWLLNFIFGWIPFVGMIWGLITLIPSIAVAVCRLHDTNHSGWWWWLAIVPVIGWIWLLVLYCTPSTPGANEYGTPEVA